MSKPHILVVEDNPADVDLLQRALGKAELDCELTVIDDGAEALALARQSRDANSPRLDLAIIDLNLPKHGGLEILEEMRKNQSFTGLPVLIFTSSSSLRERAIMQRLRVGRFVTKPPDLEEFLRIGQVVKELLAENGSLPEKG
jgi:two-component system, chemotaxis family, response regulator Rcp1